MAICQHPPTISYGVAIWKRKKWEMDKEPQRESRERMQKKANAPCNNQLKRTKRKEDKKKPYNKKIVSRKVPPKEPGRNRIPTT
jgi:hypothetical protein